MNIPNIPVYEFVRASHNMELEREVFKIKSKCQEYNRLRADDFEGRRKKLEEFIGEIGEDVYITDPFMCDRGRLIKIGNHFFSNCNLVVLDEGGVTFGDYVFIGPNVCITTAEHALDPDLRKEGYEVEKPIKIGNNVWIGAGVTIVGGVTIGDNSVIGAGAVVNKDIPAGVVAGGVPCRVIHEITEAERTRYPMAQVE